MTKQCFSNRQLYTLRNEISVEILIQTLRIPCKMTEGCFRFLCPFCRMFDTAVNPKTNLARCFRCEKNFNTIDLVMITRQTDFVQSVKFLQSIHHKNSVCQDRDDLGTISGSNPLDGKSDGGPCRIGKILGSVLPLAHGGISEERPIEYKPKEAVHQKADEDRIVKLEQQLESLTRQIEKMAQTINAGLPSK